VKGFEGVSCEITETFEHSGMRPFLLSATDCQEDSRLSPSRISCVVNHRECSESIRCSVSVSVSLSHLLAKSLRNLNENDGGEANSTKCGDHCVDHGECDEYLQHVDAS
jgi:hypothetical protein